MALTTIVVAIYIGAVLGVRNFGGKVQILIVSMKDAVPATSRMATIWVFSRL